jgi:hypothetical protein
VSADIYEPEEFRKGYERLRGGGGGSDDGGVEALIKRVDGLETDMKAVAKDIAEIKGKLSQMPTTFQLMSWFVGVAMGLTLLVFTIAKTVK